MSRPRDTNGRAAATATRYASWGWLAPHVAFGLLLAVNVWRTLDHAMWRDELQAFMIALDSRTLVDLFHRLRYESHPGLWYLLLWAITRVTADPMWMQVAQATIAAGVWLLIHTASPFDVREKFLLLLGYFLFWEYFVLSRGYALMALLGLGVVALRARGRRGLLLWVLLGLLANTVVYGAIWSIAMAAFVAREQLRANERSVVLAGVAVYAMLLAVAAATMWPPTDRIVPQGRSGFAARPVALFAVPVDALVPFPVSWVKQTYGAWTTPDDGPCPRFWNPVPTDAIASAFGLADHPLRGAIILVAAVVVCWLIVPDRWLVAEFTMGYVGVLLFAVVSHFYGYARHHGVVLLMLIGVVWLWRARGPGRPRRPWVWWTILAVNALTGITTLASVACPFSQGRNVAAWLRAEGLDGAPLLGSDGKVATVAGYLGRPIYHLECECPATFVVSNARRLTDLGPSELGRRVTRSLESSVHADALLILSYPLPPETEASTPELSFALARAFAPSVVRGESYFVYRVTRRRAGALPG